MLSAYAVRRLSEASKITDKEFARRYRVRRFPLVGVAPDVWTRDEWHELFDMGAGRGDELPMLKVCNQIIHSWILTFSEPEPVEGVNDGIYFDGIYVCSDKARSSHLYFIPLAVLIDLFRSIGNDEVNSITMRRDEQGVAYWGEIKNVTRAEVLESDPDAFWSPTQP